MREFVVLSGAKELAQQKPELELTLRFIEHPYRMLDEGQAMCLSTSAVVATGKAGAGLPLSKSLRDDDAGFFAFEFGGLRELAAKEFDEAA
jgi:hypothetical protein